jgi:hypothetical protein
MVNEAKDWRVAGSNLSSCKCIERMDKNIFFKVANFGLIRLKTENCKQFHSNKLQATFMYLIFAILEVLSINGPEISKKTIAL